MRAVSLIPLIVLTAAAPEPAALDTLAPDAEARWVPFELTPANQIRFAASVDGRPVVAILDTGVSYSLLARPFVDAAKMRVRAGTPAVAIGGAVATGWVDTATISVGALTRRGGRVTTAALPSAATGGAAVDLLIGRDLTGGYALEIDYRARRFRLLPSGRLPFRGSIAPLRIGGSWPSYVTEITIGAHRIQRIVVDTGDGGEATLTRAAWSAVPDRPATTRTATAYGIGGRSVLGVAAVPTLRSGTQIARDVEVRVEPDTGFTASIGMNGRIGSGILSRYRVLLDPGAGRMVLAPAE